MDDLVEGLRCFEISDALGDGDFSICYKAANRIEALEAELTEARAECLEQARIIGAGGERELALMAEVARLRDALRPFARHVGKNDSPVTLTIGADTWSRSLTTDDFSAAYECVHEASPAYREWRARQALKGTGQ